MPPIRISVIIFLLIAANFALFPCATTSGSGLGGGITPGKYTKWNGFIDELEIFQPISIAKYTGVVVLPIDTASPPRPKKDDNTYEPVTKVLGSMNSIFV